MRIPVQASAWPFAGALWSATMAGSGSNQNPGAAQSSVSPSRSDREEHELAPRVLVVEDSRADVFLIREALTAAGLGRRVFVAEDGEAAIQFFMQADADPSSPCPDIVILDLNLPKRKGSDVLRHLRASSRCAAAKVLVVTSSNLARERAEMDRLGSDGYFCKPSEFDEFMRLGPLVRALLGLDTHSPGM
jgi:CheY-like chemotaxis protein